LKKEDSGWRELGVGLKKMAGLGVELKVGDGSGWR
jgi:hypothetical protein